MEAERLCILVVDDEQRYVRSLRAILDASGFETLGALDGQTAVEIAAREKLSLILLDVLMPKMGGVEVCQRIREFSNVPIIMLTALSQKTSVVKGLGAGADDYITKPFCTDELLARVQATLRRAGSTNQPPVKADFQVGDLRINFACCEVFIAEQPVHLTPTEYNLLCELARSAGQVVSADTILEKVWGKEYSGEENLIPRVVHRLRQKIEPATTRARLIITRPGIGYMLNLHPENND